MRPSKTLRIVFLGGVSALLVWKLGGFIWPRFGWWTVPVLAVVFVLLNVAGVIKYWLAGRRGLDQWPQPHGRYYDEWMTLPEGTDDYYEWLCGKMGGGEPWSGWARADRVRSDRAN